jgi:hypothetical protein
MINYQHDNATANYWLRSKRYDLLLFHLSVFVGFIALIPYYIWGINAAFLLYVAQSIVAGGPHVYLTMVTLASSQSRRNINMTAVGLTLLLSIFLAALVVLYRGEQVSNILLSLIFFLAAWHSYRQHYGISKIYDYVIGHRYQDSTLSKDMKPLYLFYGLAMNFTVIYAFSIPKVPYIIARGWQIELWYPRVPIYFIYAYLVVMALIGIWAVKKSVYDRLRSGRVLPVPQFLLMGSTMFAALVLYFILPPEAYMLMWIIPTLGHNIQYFGFVWLFETKRVEIIDTEKGIVDGPLSLVKKSKWVSYFGISYVATLLVLAISFVLGFQAVSVFITYIATVFHYVGDGVLWKKTMNRHVVPVSRSLV